MKMISEEGKEITIFIVIFEFGNTH